MATMLPRGRRLLIACSMSALVALTAATRPGCRITGRLREGLRGRTECVHVRLAAARDQQDLPKHDQHQRVRRRLWTGQPVQQRAQPEQSDEQGRGRPRRECALVNRLARPHPWTAGPARAEGPRPLLCARSGRSLHRGLPQSRQRPSHEARLLRHRRPRPAQPANPHRNAPDRFHLQPRLDHRVNPTEGQERPCQRPPHPGRLHADSTLRVRDRPGPHCARRILTASSRTIRCPPDCSSSTCSGDCSGSSRRRRPTGPSCASSPPSGSAPG